MKQIYPGGLAKFPVELLGISMTTSIFVTAIISYTNNNYHRALRSKSNISNIFILSIFNKVN